MNTPIVLDLYKDLSEEDKLERTAQDHANLIGERLANVRNLARENVKKAQTNQKRNFDKKVKETKFKIGEQVLLWDSSTDHTYGDKFRDKYKGPYTIDKANDNGTYKLREVEPPHKLLKTTINGNRLKKYYQRPQWTPKVFIPQTKVPITNNRQEEEKKKRLERISKQINKLAQDGDYIRTQDEIDEHTVFRKKK
jgi:Skp family chaperone for outer membrane proteins